MTTPCTGLPTLAVRDEWMANGWRDDIALAAQMLTWGDEDGGLTNQQDREIRAHQKKIFFMLAATHAPAPAEVPTPGDIPKGDLNLMSDAALIAAVLRLQKENQQLRHDIGRHVEICPAREAAGYARGREEAGRDAARYRWLRGDGCSNSERWTRWEIQRWNGVWNPIQGMEMDAYVDAALRGEVSE